MNEEREETGMDSGDEVDRIHPLDEGEEGPEDRALRAELQALPLEAFPSRDLWAGIEARMQPRLPSLDMGPVGAGPSGRTPRPTLRLSWGQAAAAGLALMLLSGSLVWVGLGRGGAAPQQVAGEGGVPGAMEIQMAAARDAFGEYDLALSDLRRIVDEFSGSLEPATVEVLEENLEAVEAALLEAREALLADPSGEVLGRLLSGTMRRRLTVLRAAVSTAMAQS